MCRPNIMKTTLHILLVAMVVPFLMQTAVARPIELGKDEHIVLIGTGMASRMTKFGHFEAELYLSFPEQDLVIRNMADEGNTPGFRPHPGRPFDLNFAFPGAKELVKKEFLIDTLSTGHFESPDQWLTRLRADTIIAFFGYNSSFDGEAGLERYRQELEGFVKHTLSRRYNGYGPPKLVLVSPTAFEAKPRDFDGPDGAEINQNLELYTQVMAEVATDNNVLYIDAFSASKVWYAGDQVLTTDGILLNDQGYRKLAVFLTESIFDRGPVRDENRDAVIEAVNEKNWAWLNNFKIPNGVHVYGTRYDPFGPQNYPDELRKTEEMTAVRDRAIWSAVKGSTFDLEAEDAKTHALPPVPTNYTISAKNGITDYFPGDESADKIQTAEGYRMELFASEREFPDLANPSQIAFDNKGRLWVATMPSYPHYRIGDPKPDDKLLILEDTDNDGKADKQTVFADGLHIPIGFEIAPEGVYVSQSDSLILLKDTDGDDHYDEKEYLFSGFDDHDTHHAISAFTVDPSGALFMGEGLFLHSNVETIYGPERGTSGGYFRYQPSRRKLTRIAQMNIPNPWGITFDDYGQSFFLHTSGPAVSWLTPNMVKPIYGYNMLAPQILTDSFVRPTSGLEIVSSAHFPDQVQGDLLFNNSIGFLGAKQHQIMEDGSRFTARHRQDLFSSSDLNFRPVDLEFAPDGSLYVADWHNVLIGHMQHNARDPLRDHVHGRIYRITYPSRPLLKPVKIHGASISNLLDNLKHEQFRTRYRVRRELRGREADAVLPAVKAWAAEQNDERLKLEALWVTWGHNAVDTALLNELFSSEDHRIRSAVVTVARYNLDQLAGSVDLIETAADDPHGRVRLEALVAASWLPPEIGLPIIEKVKAHGLDSDIARYSYEVAEAGLQGRPVHPFATDRNYAADTGENQDEFLKLGREVYSREAFCGTCHQPDGQGLPDVGFPSLANTTWVTGDKETLIKITLKGLAGPIEVNGKSYPGHVPMTGFEGLASDQELAAVLTYVRTSFGNDASPVSQSDIKTVREKYLDVNGPLDASTLTSD